MNILVKLLRLIVAPVSKFIAYFHIPEPKVSMLEYQEMRSLLKDGDVLVSRKDWALSNVLMPGEWKHCGVFFQGHVYEAVTAGFRRSTVEEFFFKKDMVGVSRFKPLNDDQISWSVIWLEQKIGSKYDYSFSISDDDKYFCSEVVYLLYSHLFEDFAPNFKTSKMFGQTVVRPTDLWKNSIKIGLRTVLFKK
jgi:uncharacterized protein YycO